MMKINHDHLMRVMHRKQERKRRLKKGNQEKSLTEERLDEIGILWEARTIKVEEGHWVSDRKRVRKKRLEKGSEKKSLAEERLDEIGILWNAR